MFVQFRRGPLAGVLLAGFVLGCARPATVDDDGAPGVICEVETDDSECDVCVKTSCCQQYIACYDDPSCMCVLNCATVGEGHEVCADRCGLAEMDYNSALATLNGGEKTCQLECQDACDADGVTEVRPVLGK
jgi:hypothetical protein